MGIHTDIDEYMYNIKISQEGTNRKKMSKKAWRVVMKRKRKT